MNKKKGLEEDEEEENALNILSNYQDKIRGCSNQLTKRLHQIDHEEKENTVKLYLADNLKYEK